MRRMFSEKQIKDLADARVESLVEGGTLDNAKPIYWHTIKLIRSGVEGLSSYLIYLIILNNNPNAMTDSEVQNAIKTEGFVAIPHNSRLSTDAGATKFIYDITRVAYKDNATFYVDYYDSDGSLITEYTLGFSSSTINDLGVNKIN